MRECIKWILMLLYFAIGIPVFAQQSGSTNDAIEHTIYLTNLLQIENLQMTADDPDSLIAKMVSDAESLAAEQNWDAANTVLETIIDMFAIPELSQVSEKQNVTSLENDAGNYSPIAAKLQPRFEIESGIDYSQQEFEVSFLENDSVLTDELRSPYVSFNWFQPFEFGAGNLSLSQRFRLDDTFLSVQAFASFERRNGSKLFRLETDHSFYHPQNGFGSDFLDQRLQILFGKPMDLRRRWYVSGRARYKWFSQNTATDIPENNIISASGTFFFEPVITAGQSFRLSWSPAFYRESDGYKYSQNQFSGGYRYLAHYNRYLDATLQLTQYRFKNQTGETDYENRYWEFQPEIETEFGTGEKWGVESRLDALFRRNKIADSVMPDFDNFSLRVLPKYYLSNFQSFGAGFFWEKQVHSVDDAAEADFAKEGDYHSKGVTLSLEVLNNQGLMLSLAYELSWRDYPNVDAETFLDSYYSDRRIHSLMLIGWVPLTSSLQLQTFANYDNDQDRSELRNDSRNTLLNLGFLYSF
ncbi:MAG: hypothetical protein KDH98_11580 [Calditrichaeota bacterium]|nr:hypothetical protein [Calditrichota bacterium]